MKFFTYLDDFINWHLSLGWMVIPTIIGELIIIKLTLSIFKFTGWDQYD